MRLLLGRPRWKSFDAPRPLDVLAISTHTWRRSTQTSIAAISGAAGPVLTTPPGGPSWPSGTWNHPLVFVNGHGGQLDPTWYGEQSRGQVNLPHAVDAARLRGIVRRGTVVAAECCYGSMHWNPATAGGQAGVAARPARRGCRRRVGLVDDQLRPGRRQLRRRHHHSHVPRDAWSPVARWAEPGSRLASGSSPTPSASTRSTSRPSPSSTCWAIRRCTRLHQCITDPDTPDRSGCRAASQASVDGEPRCAPPAQAWQPRWAQSTTKRARDPPSPAPASGRPALTPREIAALQIRTFDVDQPTDGDRFVATPARRRTRALPRRLHRLGSSSSGRGRENRSGRTANARRLTAKTRVECRSARRGTDTCTQRRSIEPRSPTWAANCLTRPVRSTPPTWRECNTSSLTSCTLTCRPRPRASRSDRAPTSPRPSTSPGHRHARQG